MTSRRFPSNAPRQAGLGHMAVGALALCALAIYSPSPGRAAESFAESFNVELNQTKALNFSEPVASILLGNPSIADVHVDNAKRVYVLGRAFGQTNLIALDAEGKTVAMMNVNVTSQSADNLTLNRGTGQVSYNCTPRCERVINITDSSDNFSELSAQISAMATMASKGAKP